MKYTMRFKASFWLIFFFVCNSIFVFAQKNIVVESKEYKQLKKEGKLPLIVNGALNKDVLVQQKKKDSTSIVQKKPNHPPQTLSGSCNCYIPPDNTYSLAMQPNDDDSSPLIPIPFNFCLYGTQYNSLYINNNGNVSFGSPYGTFSANSFPDPSFVMVAPFWADVMTDDGVGGWLGKVWYKVTPTAIFVNWDSVGYFNAHGEKRNTFQLILTNGADPILPLGTNVSFCYKDMQWTTGDASNGVQGFGGIPATVGANKGDGVSSIQFGTFDQAGAAFDGPFNLPDGVDWLDYKQFIFDACANGNTPPIVSGVALCDTIKICEGDTFVLPVTFLSPELGQVTTANATAPGVNNFSILSNTPGNTAVIVAQIIADASNFGYNTITFTGTDNGIPVQTTTVNVVVHIDTFATVLPAIIGAAGVCPGDSTVLNLNSNYTTYEWLPGGQTTPSVKVPAGTYTVIVSFNGCSKVATHTVVQYPNASPEIIGLLHTCDNDSAILSVDSTYVSYLWNPGGITNPSIRAGAGTFTVTVTDANGCKGTSAPINVTPSPKPLAAFSITPADQNFINTVTSFIDQSTVAAPATIVGWNWDFGDAIGTSVLQNPSYTFLTPGKYTVKLIVETQDGCLDTITKEYEILPQIILPINIFTPNNDKDNNFMAFKNLQYFPNSSLRVYNRWGNKIFESADYKNDWDGGKAPDGVYYYILQIPNKEPITGFVTILR